MRLPAVLLTATLALAGCHTNDPGDDPGPIVVPAAPTSAADADPADDRARTAAIRQATADRLAQIAERAADAARAAQPRPEANRSTPAQTPQPPSREGTVVCQTDPDLCRRVQQATAVLPDDWPTLGWDIVAGPPHDWAGGIADRRLRTLTIHVRDAYTDAQVADILAHEFGHAWWAERLDDHQRTRWRHLRGLDGAPLYADGPHDNTAVTEDHAEAAKQALTGRHNGTNPPTDSQLDTWAAVGLLPPRP